MGRGREGKRDRGREGGREGKERKIGGLCFMSDESKEEDASVFFVTLRNVGRFLQRGRIACNAERCNTYSNSVCLSVRPSVRLSHAGTLSRRMNIGLRGLHCEVAKTL